MEYESCNFGLFVTLTYSDESLPLGGVCKRDIQLWLKRLRKHFKSNVLRYFIVSEYGDHTYRPHYHALLFFKTERKDDIYDIILESWNNGFCYFGEVEEGSIVYCTKYCLKQSSVPKGKEKNFRLVSKMNGGIGANYLQVQSDYHSDLTIPQIVKWRGQQAPMPRYYRTKLLQPYYQDEDSKEDIKREYALHIEEMRQERYFKRFYKWKSRYKIDLPYDEARIAFDEHERLVNERKEQKVLNHTKKQNIW